MMKIYERQIAVLAGARASEFENRIVRLLRAWGPAGGSDDESALRCEVHERIAEAYAAGLDTERLIATYVVGVVRFGEVFLARIEPLRPRLTDVRVDPADKARLLLGRYAELSRGAQALPAEASTASPALHQGIDRGQPDSVR